MATISFNIPLLTIPLYYVIASYPHFHAVMVSTKGDLKLHDNRNAYGERNMANTKRRLTERDFAKFERAQACHRNHLENAWLFVAAVFAGMMAENRAGEGEIGLTTFCIGWLLIRILYTINYIYVETVGWSFVRSLLYNVGSIYAFWTIGKAAWVLGN